MRKPKLFDSLRGYTVARFVPDLVAGVTVGLVSLPLAMAFAIASGVPPQAGLYCGIVAGFIISFLGGSRTQIGGPTGAFVVIVSGIVAVHGFDGLLVCTFLAGAMLVVLGATGLGAVVRFIPRPVIVGFTNGIAVLIASTQIKDFFGLQIDAVPGDFTGRIQTIAEAFHTIDAASTVLATCSLLLILACMRWVRKVPGSIVAMLLGSIVVAAFGLPVATIESRFGGIPTGIPDLVVPRFDPSLLPVLISPALTVALLGAIESLLSAVVADRMSGDRHDPNVELVAQGVANMVVPFVGGLPATGAIARTATNIRSGARTPVAGMINALTLLVILVVAAPLAGRIPLPVLAAILFVVAWNMGEWREIPKLLRLSPSSVVVWLATFALTVFADLTVAVQVGIVLAALLYIRKVTGTTSVSRVTREYLEAGRPHSLQLQDIPEGVTVVRIHGPFLFGAVEKLGEAIEPLDSLGSVVVLRLRNMTALDATGVLALEDAADRIRESGRTVILCGARPQPAALLHRSGIERRIGPENVCTHFAAAMDRARAALVRE